MLLEIVIIMNDQEKTKEELSKELKKLQKEYTALKESFEKYSTEHKWVEDALRTSEENFRSIFEDNSAAMALIEPDTTVSMVNEEYCRLSGYTRQEAIGMSWTQLIPPQDLERLKEYNRNRLINPKDSPDKYEFTFYQKNGNIKQTLVSITMLSNRRVITSFVDITAHKQAEAALRESEEKYSNAFQTAPYAIAITSAKDGKLIEINDAFTSITGFTQEDITSDSTVSLNIWVDIEDRKGMVTALTEGSEVKCREFQFRKKNGEIISGLFSAQIIHINDKRFILSSTQDITESKRAEEALFQERYLLSTLMDNIPDHIYFKDRKSCFLRNSRAHVLSFGLSDPKHLVGKSDFDFFEKEIARRQYNDEQEIIRTGQPINKEEFTVRNDGSTNWYSSTKMPLRDTDGTIVGTFGISRDVTDRKLAEEELNLKNEQLNKANAEKDKFFSIIAHDLRSPFYFTLPNRMDEVTKLEKAELS